MRASSSAVCNTKARRTVRWHAAKRARLYLVCVDASTLSRTAAVESTTHGGMCAAWRLLSTFQHKHCPRQPSLLRNSKTGVFGGKLSTRCPRMGMQAQFAAPRGCVLYCFGMNVHSVHVKELKKVLNCHV